MANEGVIKFNYKCLDEKFLIHENEFNIINPVRQLLKEKKYIGQYPDGICYGNVSMRCDNTDEFYITASDTGKLMNTGPSHYVKITSCDLKNNLCFYKGSALPSSETLSHFIIYTYCPEAKAVIHIHDKKLWHKLKNKVPTSHPDVAYGTLQMVNEIIYLLQNSSFKEEKILVMGGHEEGLISFGESMDAAYKLFDR